MPVIPTIPTDEVWQEALRSMEYMSHPQTWTSFTSFGSGVVPEEPQKPIEEPPKRIIQDP